MARLEHHTIKKSGFGFIVVHIICIYLLLPLEALYRVRVDVASCSPNKNAPQWSMAELQRLNCRRAEDGGYGDDRYIMGAAATRMRLIIDYSRATSERIIINRWRGGGGVAQGSPEMENQNRRDASRAPRGGTAMCIQSSAMASRLRAYRIGPT